MLATSAAVRAFFSASGNSVKSYSRRPPGKIGTPARGQRRVICRTSSAPATIGGWSPSETSATPRSCITSIRVASARCALVDPELGRKRVEEGLERIAPTVAHAEEQPMDRRADARLPADEDQHEGDHRPDVDER